LNECKKGGEGAELGSLSLSCREKEMEIQMKSPNSVLGSRGNFKGDSQT